MINTILKKIAVAAFCILVIGVIGDAVLLLGGSFREQQGFCDPASDFGEDGEATTAIYNVRSPQYQALDLQTTGDVRVVAGDGEQASVRIIGHGRKVEEAVREELLRDQTLRIKIDMDNNPRRHGWPLSFGLDRSGDYAELILPRRQLERIIVTASSGRFSAADLVTGELEVRLRSGQLYLNGCRSDSIKLAMDSGRLEAADCHADEWSGRMSSGSARLRDVTGKVNIASSSGDLQLEMKEVSGDVRISSHSGRVQLDLGRVMTPFHLEAVTESGTADVDLPQLGQRSRGERQFKADVGGNGGPLVSVNVQSGLIQIR